MYQDSGKKIVILYILKILRDHTDANHTMTQQEIADKLLSEYGIEVSRATIKRNLADLIDADYEIYAKNEVTRSYTNKKTGEKEENTIYTDLYYDHEFTESELHMLIDGLLFSRSMPHKQRKDLIVKLAGLSSSWFSKRIQHVHSMGADSPQNPKLFHIIDTLDEAIENGKQVEIVYGYYGTDLKLHTTKNDDGTDKKQKLNPYQLVANEGRYYLICNNDKYENVANYRIDRIMDIRILESNVKPKSDVKGLENGLNLEGYVYQNLNMFTSPPVDVEFVIPAKFVSLIIDSFGKHVKFTEQNDGTVSCRIKVSATAMKHWASEHAGIVKVISPPELVEEIREEVRKAAEMYDLV